MKVLENKHLKKSADIILPVIKHQNFKAACLITGSFFLCIGLFLSYRAEPDIFSDLRLLPIIIIMGVIVPLIIAGTAMEFKLSALLVGQEISIRNALEVTVIGSAANMLPLPGAAMVRVAALKGQGATMATSIFSIAYVSLMLLGASLIYGGAAIIRIGEDGWGAFFVSTGLLILLMTYVQLRNSKYNSLAAIKIIILKFVLLVLDAARLFLCFMAIRSVISFEQASVFTFSVLFGSAISIVPAGLGIREGAAAFIAPMVSLTPAAAFLATLLSRVLALFILIPTAFLLAMRNQKKPFASISSG